MVRLAAFALILFGTLLLGPSGQAQTPEPQVVADTGSESMEWRRSFAKSLSYQTIVVTTDQIIYFIIVTGTPVTELEFFAANAASGVAYYVLFDDAWRSAVPTAGDGHVSIAKAIVYRLFDTMRVFSVSFAIGTPLAGSLAVTAASAVVRTCVYILHDYVWSFISFGREPAAAAPAH